MLALALGTLLGLGAMAAWGGLDAEGLRALAWPVAVLTSAAMGANVGEHAWGPPAGPPAS
jgi:hypothetical protein